MPFKTTIEYLDGKIVEIRHHHMIRPDGKEQVYRIIEETKKGEFDTYTTKESIIPFCVVRKQTSEAILED